MISEVKWIIGAGIALTLIFGGYKLYNLGWDAHAAKVTSDNNIAIKAAVAQAQIEWQASQQITTTGMGNTNDTKQKLEVIIKQAATIQAPLCTDLGSDYSRVYNAAIGTIKAGADTRRHVPATEVPAQPVGGATGIDTNHPDSAKGGVGH
ncbi:hypothetical protein D3C76_102630 [compost metagenome]